MESLWQAGARVRAFDPEAMEETHRIYGERDDLELVEGAEAALEGADALVVITEWHPFRSPDFAMMKKHLKQPVGFDGRNIYDPDYMASQGFTYYAIGRPPVGGA